MSAGGDAAVDEGATADPWVGVPDPAGVPGDGRQVLQPPDRRGRLVFCPARFGDGVVGGAELVMATQARMLAARGWDVEVLTTCATDHFSWDNVLPPGTTDVDGLTVTRFPVVVDTPGVQRAEAEQVLLSGGHLSLDAQQRWMDDGPRVPGLYHHLLQHGDDYRAVVLGPYPFWPAYACAQVLPERAVLWTCLHDEPTARLELFDPVLSGVAGLFLQTPPEHALLHEVQESPARHAVVGCGVEVPEAYDPDGFRLRHGLGDAPFLLYAGRREGAKGWERLLDAFAAVVTSRGLPFHLVTFGAGPVVAPPGLEDRVHDLGFVDDRDRDDAYAAATAYVQPSRYEAFSRTVMESWLAGTPVLADGGGEVVAEHVRVSGAGLLYDDADELAECLSLLAEHPDVGARLAAPGRDYVLERYRWEPVLDRVERCLGAWTRP